jgi:hypothetical protein
MTRITHKVRIPIDSRYRTARCCMSAEWEPAADVIL